MTQLAIIGGTGLTQLSDLKIIKREQLSTPYGSPSAEFVTGELNNTQIIFLARHGNPHTIAPHKINYQANIWGLKQLGVEQIIAVAAVGGITSEMVPAHIAIPDQIIDYSYGRMHTFFEDETVTHIDFTCPYSQKLRSRLISAAAKVNIKDQPDRHLRLHPRPAPGNRRRNPAHGKRRLRSGRHDRHAGSRISQRTRYGLCRNQRSCQLGRRKIGRGNNHGRN